MHKSLSVTAAALSIVGLALFLASLYVAFTSQGPDIDMTAIWLKQIASPVLMLGLILALIARAIARRQKQIPHGASRIALAISGPFLVFAGIGAILSIFS